MPPGFTHLVVFSAIGIAVFGLLDGKRKGRE